MIAVIGSVLALCIAISVIAGITKRNNNSETHLPTVSPSATGSNSVTVQDTSNDSTDNTEPEIGLSQQILGKWADSANMSGYEFFENGSVNVTYVNLTVPIINFPINGTAAGTYTLNSQELTVSFSIYSRTIKKTYTVSIENNTLTLKDKDDGEVSTYTKQGSYVQNDTTTAAAASEPIQTGIYGAWASASGDICFTFNENGIVEISFVNASMPSVSAGSINGSYNGAFFLDETYKNITVQFTYNSKTVTLRYAYVQSNNSLSLNDNSGNTLILVRQSAAAVSSADALIGKWYDSTGMSGYEFKRNGLVDLIYVNFTVPVINMPINGTYSGTYKVDGNKLTISSSIYSRTVTDEYTFSINGNTLSLLSTADGELSTYSKK